MPCSPLDSDSSGDGDDGCRPRWLEAEPGPTRARRQAQSACRLSHSTPKLRQPICGRKCEARVGMAEPIPCTASEFARVAWIRARRPGWIFKTLNAIEKWHTEGGTRLWVSRLLWNPKKEAGVGTIHAAGMGCQLHRCAADHETAGTCQSGGISQANRLKSERLLDHGSLHRRGRFGRKTHVRSVAIDKRKYLQRVCA